MLEFPEAYVMAEQITDTLKGERIRNVITGQSPHKFTWYYGDPEKYQELLTGKVINKAVYCGGQVEIQAENIRMLFGDGVSLRFYREGEKLPPKHQLDVEFEDDSHLIGSVQMYGGLGAFEDGTLDNKYYHIAKEKPVPLSKEFNQAYFDRLLMETSEKLSMKAVLATEQRIPGLGNGVLQDILYHAGLHPKKKLGTLSDAEKEVLFYAIKSTLAEMIAKGGRDTERDLYGCLGGYKTSLSKNTVDKPCTRCGTTIKKEAYLGGSIYYCEGCQQK